MGATVSRTIAVVFRTFHAVVAVIAVVAVAAAVAVVAVGAPACASAPTRTVAPAPQPAEAAIFAVRRSLVQRVVQQAPAVTRSGVARLVSLVPLDDARVARLADAMARALFVERLEQETARRLERALSPEELPLLLEALADADVRAVIDAALAADPAAGELERFVDDPASLAAPRQAKVRALMAVTWTPQTVDKLTRAPVIAAGRIVAAATRDADEGRRSELLRLAEGAPPSDPDSLVVAFAFLWRALPDETLESARDFFSSDLGARSTKALVEGVVEAAGALAEDVARDVRG